MGVLSFSSQAMSDSRDSLGIYWICAQNFLKSAPYRFFVKWSMRISSIGQCFTFRSPTPIRSLIKKYLTRICFLRCVINLHLCFSNNIALMLS